MASRDPTPVHHAVDLIQTQDDVVGNHEDLIASLSSLSLPETIDMHSASTWDELLRSMMVSNLLDFPTPEVGSWNSCVGKIRYAEEVANLLCAVLGRKEDIFQKATETLKGLFSQMFPMMYKLDLWLDLDSSVQPDLISPLALRMKVVEAMKQIARGAMVSQELQEFFDELVPRILEFNQSESGRS